MNDIGCLPTLVPTVSEACYPASYSNSFENQTDSLEDPSYGSNDAMFYVRRVSSGTNGTNSAGGTWHAVAEKTNLGPHCIYSRYGGYSNVFPPGGYSTSIDIYLDLFASPKGKDLRFDWSSAINTPSGTRRRDFIFNVSTDSQGGFAISASNRVTGWPTNPDSHPFFISTSGWYRFYHHFRNKGGGVLAVDMCIMDMAGNVLNTWTLSNPADIIGRTVGGNRYGWLVINEFDHLALDNITRCGAVPHSTSPHLKGGWQKVFETGGCHLIN
jgi:hypothetical protein